MERVGPKRRKNIFSAQGATMREGGKRNKGEGTARGPLTPGGPELSIEWVGRGEYRLPRARRLQIIG